MQHTLFRMALVLGLLSAIGPFAIDMYLPALPAIGHALHADVHAVQASLMAFFVSFAISQIVYGPASDIVGRKPPLYLGIALFVAGSIGCALAPDIGWLIAFRFVQGLGGGAPIVVPRAIVRDLHTGAEATQLMALLMLVFSVSPILAPLVGSLVIDAAGWRAIFWLVGALGAVGLLLVAFTLPETRPAAQRAHSDVASALRAFGVLLRDARFMGLTAVGAFGIASFFVYLANSSFVLIGRYGLTPREYSLAFAVNAASFIGASQFAGRLAQRFGLARTIGVAVHGFALAMVALLALNLAGIERLDVMIAVLLVGNAFLGLVLPTSSVLALDDHGEIAGAASALMGALQLVMGAVVIAAMAGFVDGSARPMVAGIAACAVVTLLVARWTLGGTRRATAGAS
ncbi:MAG TPA: multidrug effflux MFS transporter [Burkholderiaceae bacterium]|nr:multidrug effflux MFS transporter [Burkholderiaceae bacterium]